MHIIIDIRPILTKHHCRSIVVNPSKCQDYLNDILIIQLNPDSKHAESELQCLVGLVGLFLLLPLGA
jgi:hypothetical protein